MTRRGWWRSTACASTSVDVHYAHRLFDRRELLRPPLGLGAAREVAERLAVGVVVLVEGEDLQQRLVEVPVRDLLEHDVAELRVLAQPAADADVHRLDELAVDLLEHALDADVGDLVLRAARRAAREVQAEVLAVAVGAHVLVQELGDLDRAALGVDLRQAAELLAGAGLQAALEERRRGGEVGDQRLGEQRVDVLVRDPRQQDVLLVGEAQRVVLVGAVLAGELGELEQLVRLQAADRDDEADRAVDAVGLREDADVVLAREARGLRHAVAQRRGRRGSMISSRSASGPMRSTRNFRRALPRAFRFSSESRKIPVTAATTSGASSGETKMSTQRAKRGCVLRPAADAQVEALGAVLVDRGRRARCR